MRMAKNPADANMVLEFTRTVGIARDGVLNDDEYLIQDPVSSQSEGGEAGQG